MTLDEITKKIIEKDLRDEILTEPEKKIKKNFFMKLIGGISR